MRISVLYQEIESAEGNVIRRWLALAIAVGLLWPASTVLAAGGTQGEEARASASLSEYWSPRIRRWTPYIVDEAESWQLDPDFLASLVWMESRGDPRAVGPVGAVGLMQVMPKEAGFSWRPSREALMDPAVNLHAGCRTLVDIIHQGKGDLFNTLAAYNGGWEQIMYRGPKYFATTIMRDYAAAVAARHGLAAGGRWIAFFAPLEGETVLGPIWVADASRADVFYFGDNHLPDGSRLIPSAQPPTAIIARYAVDGRTDAIALWLYDFRAQRWIQP